MVPARAGVDLWPDRSITRASGGPRASGGGPEGKVVELLGYQWSPRERGWTVTDPIYARHGGVVPARAGVDRPTVAA